MPAGTKRPRPGGGTAADDGCPLDKCLRGGGPAVAARRREQVTGTSGGVDDGFVLRGVLRQRCAGPPSLCVSLSAGQLSAAC